MKALERSAWALAVFLLMFVVGKMGWDDYQRRHVDWSKFTPVGTNPFAPDPPKPMSYDYQFASVHFLTGTDLNTNFLGYDRVNSSGGKNTSQDDFANVIALSSYVKGVADSFQGLAFCNPNDAVASQLVSVVEKYVKENPKYWAYNGSAIVRVALSDAFPCAVPSGTK